MSLTPSFTGKVSSVHFTPLNDYKSKTEEYWLGLSTTRWDDELRVKQNVLFEEKDEYKKEWLRSDLKAWMLKKPKNVTVDEKKRDLHS